MRTKKRSTSRKTQLAALWTLELRVLFNGRVIAPANLFRLNQNIPPAHKSTIAS